MSLRKAHSYTAVLVCLCSAVLFMDVLFAQSEVMDGQEVVDKLLSRPTDNELPSLSATHISWHEPSGQEIMSANIELSPTGLRVTELGAGASHEMLQDFIGQRAWLINHIRSISHLLPLVEMDSLGAASPGASASFLGHRPCGGLIADDQGEGRWRGRRVTAFHCVDESEDVLSIEFLDKIHNIIVYSRTIDGYVNELRGLTNRTFDESHFIPPPNYRDVEKQEFFFGAPALLPYSPPVAD